MISINEIFVFVGPFYYFQNLLSIPVIESRQIISYIFGYYIAEV